MIVLRGHFKEKRQTRKLLLSPARQTTLSGRKRRWVSCQQGLGADYKSFGFGSEEGTLEQPLYEFGSGAFSTPR